jgi:hypothetical protein
MTLGSLGLDGRGVYVPNRRYSGAMARPPKDDDATQNLKPEDKTQRAKKGTKIGLLPKDEVMAVFRKIAKPR